MATIEKTGHKWRVRQFQAGKLRTVARCATKQEAEAVLRRAEEEERARSRVVYGSQLPLTEVIARWRIAREAEGNDPLHTANAAKRLRTIVKARNWQSTSAVTALSVSDYRADGGSPRACAMLASVLRWAKDYHDQYIDPKVLVALRPGRSGRRPSPDLLTAQQVAEAEATAGAMGDSAGLLIHCLSTYGWRPITAARLSVGDFDAVTGFITCSVKGGDIVRHPLMADTANRLRLVANAKSGSPLFRDPRTGERWPLVGGSTISQWARWHLGIKVYDLKRYAISTMLNHGISPQDIASFTGHRTVSQVLKYGRSNEQRQRSSLLMMGKKMESGSDATGQGGPAK